MRQRWAFVLIFALLVALALGLRLPKLSERPFHADESVHAIKFGELRRTGRYTYDPNEYHGPTIYYAALPVVLLRGHNDFTATTESDFRATVGLFGAGMLLFLLPLVPALGHRAVLIAALLLVISPASVFYSRYYIQETPLVFATLGLLACGWRYFRKPSMGWAVGAGVCAGFMIASKETAVLTFGAIGLAVALTLRGEAWQYLRQNRQHLIQALVALFLVASAFLSGFGTNPRGPLDLFVAYTPWLGRAGGTDVHRHGMEYYLRLLVWPEDQKGFPMTTEALIVLLALVGIAVSIRGPRRYRFLAFYTLILTLGYSIIPYKTPWCILTFLQGMALLAAIGVSAIYQKIGARWGKAVFLVCLLPGIGHLLWQTYTVNFVAFNDLRNPYIYSPTAPETPQITDKILPIAQASPDGDRMVIKIFSRDEYYWPLPWYLRRFSNVGYWIGLPPDGNVQAPVVLSSSEFDEELTKKLDATHLMTGFFALRPGVLMQMWVRMDLWQEYLKKRPPEQDE